MKARIFPFLALAALAAALCLCAAAGASQKFTGLVTDNMCPKGDHSAMQMGPTNAECVKACVRIHGALYVLYDGKQTYTLSDQETPEKFAGQKVTVTGTLDSKAGTIQVQSIAPAK
jgi:hypothetical protein